MFGRKIIVVRADKMDDKALMKNLQIGPDHHAMLAVNEIGKRLEEELMDEAFTGTTEHRMRNMARMEGARELVALVEEWRQRAIKEIAKT